MIYHIVAMSRNRVIGKNNKLPWHFPEDLQHFKKLTMGSTVIMGRKTFESIGKPLPNRENFVVSRTRSGSEDHLQFFDSVEKALDAATTDDIYIIGGAELYRQTITLDIDGIYLTRIDRDYEGDAFYPEISEDEFEEVEIEVIRAHDPKIEVVFYERK